MKNPRWKLLAPVLAKWQASGKVNWTVYDVAKALHIKVWAASYLIQLYVKAQHNRTVSKRPILPIHRADGTRTRSAVWVTGDQVADWRDHIHALADDIQAKNRGVSKTALAIMDSDPATAAAVAGIAHAYDLNTQALVAFLKSL